MSQESDAKFASMLDALRKNYLTRLKADLVELERLMQQLKLRQESFDLNILKKCAHGLAGSGATFGLPLISQKGAELEIACKNKVPQHELLDLTLSLIDECKIAILHQTGTPAALNAISAQNKIINIVCSDQTMLQEIFSLIKFPHYQVNKFTDLLGLNTHKSWPIAIPEIVIIVTDFSSRDCDELKLYLDHFDKDTMPEVIYISSHDNFTTRLKAVQLHGHAYFTLPVDFEQLAEKIQSSVKRAETEPYHILIIEDDQILADTYSVILEKAGMKTTVINDPREAIDAIGAKPTDIILTDFYLPHCNGLELASILRQYDIYLSIPIIFISSEVQLESLLRDAKINIDDFLTKPIKPSELANKIEKRAARARTLRNLMVRDGLTGALNRTKFQEELVIEIERAKARSSNLSYALIDIDNFKSINDTYGHAAGDMVIKSLVRNLKQRLRGSDIIGRYGGDEFAVVLLDTDKRTAVTVMNQILTKFVNMKHKTSTKEFSVSFSCGIASTEDKTDVAELCELADKAMYKAKKLGRAQISASIAGSRTNQPEKADRPGQTAF